MNPQVSVILPYFEGAQWLGKSARSVQAQTGLSWELIIVDDGSTYDPSVIVDSLHDQRLRLIRIEHAGKGAALNAGVADANADIICFIDQDDVMNPGRLVLQYNAFLRDRDVDVVYSDYERVHSDGRLIDQFISRQASNREWLKSMARSIGFISMQTIMMRKSIFDSIGGFSEDTQLTGLDDAEFFVRLCASGTVLKYIPGLVQKWVLHGQNYSESADFQKARLILLRYLSNYARNNAFLKEELPYFQYHTFFMRGLVYLELGLANRAIPEFLKAVKARPVNLNGYYLLLKSWMKNEFD